MITGIDHITIGVADLDRGVACFRRLGFNVNPGGLHAGRGTHNALACNMSDYIELLAIRDKAEYLGASSSGGAFARFVGAGGGIHKIVLSSDDIVADVAAMRARGALIADPVAGMRTTPEGIELRWRFAVLDAAHGLPLAVIEHQSRPAGYCPAVTHPNAVFALERAYIVVDDAAAQSQALARILGMDAPPLQRGTVIMSHMAIFQLGSTGLGIVQPYADGPAARALAERGTGAFQALYRTGSMGAAARWMADQGMPALERGIRNTGEHAMLATPAEACGAYIGFVGPE